MLRGVSVQGDVRVGVRGESNEDQLGRGDVTIARCWRGCRREGGMWDRHSFESQAAKLTEAVKRHQSSVELGVWTESLVLPRPHTLLSARLRCDRQRCPKPSDSKEHGVPG